VESPDHGRHPFASLSYANLHDYLVSSDGTFIYASLGSTQGAEYIVCNLNLVANTVANWIAARGGGSGGSYTITCPCVRDDCCSEQDAACIASNAESGFAARGLPVSPDKDHASHSLEKRAGARDYQVDLIDSSTNTVVAYTWRAPPVCGRTPL
jgi:hypothetical protein